MNILSVSTVATLGLALLSASASLAQPNTPQGRAARMASMRRPLIAANDTDLASAQAAGQDAPKLLAYSEANKMASYPLYISDQKTTHLVFPFPVTYVDLGSRSLIAAKATGAENIVRVKAAVGAFPETNMTVLTSDGKLYSFVVNYQRNPKLLSLDLGPGVAAQRPRAAATTAPAASGAAILSNSPIAQGNLDAYSREALELGGTAASEKKNQLSLRAGAVGYRQETLFFPLHLANKSNVSYDIDFVKFYIQDKKVAKRTAEQAIELTPVYVFNGAQKKVESRGKLEQVFVFKKFTIPDQKQLVVELYEKGGGRNVKLTIANADLLKAHTLE